MNFNNILIWAMVGIGGLVVAGLLIGWIIGIGVSIKKHWRVLLRESAFRFGVGFLLLCVFAFGSAFIKDPEGGMRPLVGLFFWALPIIGILALIVMEVKQWVKVILLRDEFSPDTPPQQPQCHQQQPQHPQQQTNSPRY